MTLLKYGRVQTSLSQSSLPAVAQHMFSLMLRNMSSDGFVFTDPNAPGDFSAPGCIIAAPTFAVDPAVNQDYVYNWTRDAANTAIELAAASIPAQAGSGIQPLTDYVNFANTCQNSGPPTIGHACYTIEGQPRPWSEQSDGPALQTLAIVQAFPQLDAPTQATATTVIATNINYLLGAYQSPTTNLWEEKYGYSFFARAVQLRCFQEITSNPYGIAVPPATANAIIWLEDALLNHWNGTSYVSILSPQPSGYDPNIDIVMASVYGAVPYTDTKLLATAAQLRRQWADSSSPSFYPINAADQGRGIGPVLGRYPADSYDGDTLDPVAGGHPWPVCTGNFAELYYGLANAITQTQTVPFDNLSEDFFSLIGVDATTPWSGAAASLQSAGDEMLNAIIFHSDHLELSEQFDGTTGYEKSVRDLTWSYAAFLSAVREKTGQNVLG
jgi:glucoamylase